MNTQIFELQRRSMYMLPTQHGWLFTLALFTMLLAAINYNNGLAYGFTFFLAATAFISMLYTHRNALGLRLSASQPAPVFCGQVAHFPITVENPDATKRINIWLITEDSSERFNIPGNASRDLKVCTDSSKRGYLSCPSVTLSTDFPFGLLFTWSKRFKPNSKCIVYPTPSGHQPLPVSSTRSGSIDSRTQSDGDDFAGLREYQKGDPLGHIHWKAVARTNQIYTKLFSGAETGRVSLDWSQLHATDTEAKLSQLSQWVIDAHDAGIRYGLKIPGLEIPPSEGADHRHRCLTALALY